MEYGHDESPQPHSSESNLQNSLDESANNSLIGKVKSRVSSILPNRFSKWFSPSAKLQNDSLNGSICVRNYTEPTLRKRRLAMEEEENYEDDEDVHRSLEYKESHYRAMKQDKNRDHDYDDDENDDDDDSQNSEDEYNCNLVKQSKSDLNVGEQPPTKRSRLNIERQLRDSPVISRHQPLLSSTPATSCAYLRSPATPNSYERVTYLNLHGYQSKKDPAFNFGQHKEPKPTSKFNTDIIDLITNSSCQNEDKFAESSNAYDNTQISSRKSLNIPSTATTTGSEHVYTTAGNLKRQPLSSAKSDLSSTITVDVPPRRTSTTILEDEVVGNNEKTHYDVLDKRFGMMPEPNVSAYNGNIDISNTFVANKRQKFINGSSLNAAVIPEAIEEGISLDSASESGESAIDAIKTNSSNIQRKTGLFNMSAGGNTNTRNSSRTSSFGNGLNFYSHLEGRKSLFNNPNHANALNNSTLSLTSLNRRQFNASIYGSTSALSDSRLLNTFSPFYKGKTTYGGAAAYNKYTAGAGASTIRITPTLIRPTSSLSTLSSSSYPLANSVNLQVGDNSAISSTAKRILDLINDFATPLSEAKKMASNLKTNASLNIPPQARSRLNESDLNASRAVRLSQVRTPYSRSPVILQPSGNASGRGTVSTVLPPIKELQVPTMSQLLKMKQLQNTTEKARKIAQTSVSNIGSPEYTLPDVQSSQTNSTNLFIQDQKKHTNKIKTKSAKSFRTSTSTKDLQDVEPPPQVNLPNIAFPLMQSAPKIDIQINKPLKHDKTSHENNSFKLSTTTQTSNATKIDSSIPMSLAFNTSSINTSTQASVSIANSSKQDQLVSNQSISTLKFSQNFTFSEPLQVVSALNPTQSTTKNEIDKYKFSPPLDITVPPSSNCSKLHNTQPKQPQLKEGSCLDALSKPPTLPPTLSKSNATAKTSSNKASLLSSGFGDQFKKPSSEWECDACMIRNKSDSNKCVACETPRKQKSSISQQASIVPATITSSFGQQFKKISNEWECDTCMVSNKEETTKCIACETPRKSDVSQNISAIPPAKNNFGNAFKTKSETWECQTCMIYNKNEVNECIACQTKKPGCANTSQSTVPLSQLKFGFATTDNKSCNTDAGFKTLAAQQKVSKWECDACMTRNDANRTKCACCEQPKPGIASAESTDITSTKFQFGATAASKFNFGFGTSVNAPKEEDLRKTLSNKTEGSVNPSSSTPSLELGAAQKAPAMSGFQFGIKTETSSSSECKKDETDSDIQTKGFKFGVSATMDVPKMSEKSDAITPSASFSFGLKTLTTTTTTIPTATTTPSTSSTTRANTPSDKFSLPFTTVSTVIFGSNPASSTTGGFSFGKKIGTNTTVTTKEEKKTTVGAVFKVPEVEATPKPSGFVFGSTTVKSSSPAPLTNRNLTTTTTSTAATPTTTAAVKPMFSFGSNTSNTSGVNTKTTPAFSSFSFGISSTSNAAATTTASSIFSAVTSTITTNPNTITKTSSFSTSSAPTTTPATTNIFGPFGGGTAGVSNATASPIFGSSVNSPANNNLSTVSSSTNNTNPSNTLQFGAFGSKSTSNVFGSFGGVGGVETKNSALVKPNETKPTLTVFGNVAPSSTQSSQSNSGGFVFGSTAANNSTVVTTASTTGSVTSTSTTWPKNKFVFGSTASATSTTTNVAPANASENKEVAKPVFGTFSAGSTNSNNQQQTTSIFGVSATNNATAPLSGPGTSASGPSSFSTNLFFTNSAPAATNIFGASSSGNAVTPAPAFSTSPFGGAASSTSATPTFGSTAASGTTFGSFIGSNSNTTTNTTEVKKPEAAFNFGVAPTAQSTSGVFNFGSSASSTKPAFNFGGPSTTQQPSFNFTGTTESSTNSGSTNSTTGKKENSGTIKTSNTAVEYNVILNAFDSVDRSQQNKPKQTELCLRQNENRSRISTKELIIQQCQNLGQDSTISQTFNNKTDSATIRSSCGTNTANVASNQQQQITNRSPDLSRKTQNCAKDCLKQKNKILLNKYKLIRKSSSVSPNADTINNVSHEVKEDISSKMIVHNTDYGREANKRIVKFKTQLSPLKKFNQIKQLPTNYYRKVNYVKIKKIDDPKEETKKKYI